MRRRLTVTIVGLVAAALVVAGLGTLVLGRAAVRSETVHDLVDQAAALADLTDRLERPGVLLALRRSLGLEGAAVVRVPPAGAPTAPVPAPRRRPGPGPLAGPVVEPVGPIALTDAELDTLRGGQGVSGWRGEVAYAAEPVGTDPGGRGGRLAVVLTRKQASGLRTAVPWFLVSAAAALAVAAADRLARRFARPVTAAGRAARRIAAGDLSVRVDPGGPGAEAELAQLAASVNSMAADLERARGLQRQFLLSVSHELRTPLTSVRGFAEAIADGAAPDDRRAAEVIGAEARRLERLVGDLLDLAKLDARAFSLHLGPVDVAEVVTDTAEGFRPAAAAAGLSLVVRVPAAGGDADHLVVTADRERLAQVVANLVENALAFATATISVAVERAGDAVVVSVADDGPGIAEDDLGQVFDRLFQSARAPARRAGSGLGLAIVSELAAAMGAGVEARSRPGATRMAVRLPARAGGPRPAAAPA